MLAAAGGLTHLTELSLRGCPAVTNAVAALLERLPALHSVDLRACEHVTGEAQGTAPMSAALNKSDPSQELSYLKWRMSSTIESHPSDVD